MAGCYGKGGREQVECGHVNGVPHFIVSLTCAKVRHGHSYAGLPVAEANIKTSVGATTAFTPGRKQH